MSLALANLLHNRVRTSIAVAGVAFAVVLVFMQLGFLGATGAAASLVYEMLDCELVIRSSQARRLAQSEPFPLSRLYTARSVAGVRDAVPFYIGFHRWRIPAGPDEGYGRRILVMGARPTDQVFLARTLQAQLAALSTPEFALIDRQARREFGPRNGVAFGPADVGSEVEIGIRGVRLVGLYELGASFEADGNVVLSDTGFCRLYPGRATEIVSLGLVRLEPGTEPEQVRAALAGALPADVEVVTRDEAIAGERELWLWEMSVGLIFIMGVGVALVVGAAIVYQILSSDVTSHLPEYATLKAIGYRERFLIRVVLAQAVALAVIGFVPGLAASVTLYWLTDRMTKIAMPMTVGRVALVLALSVAMCAVSGAAALRKLRQADPADLFV